MRPAQSAPSSLHPTRLPKQSVYAARRVSKLAWLQVLAVQMPSQEAVYLNQTSCTNAVPKPSSQLGSSGIGLVEAKEVSKNVFPSLTLWAVSHSSFLGADASQGIPLRVRT